MGNTKTFRLMQRAAIRLAFWQAMITVSLALLFVWFSGTEAMLSALVGGGIGALAGLYQALRMFRADAAASPGGFLRAAYAGEAIKILLTVALFIAAIRILKVEFGPTMIAYAATYVVYWAALNTGYPWLVNGTLSQGNQDRA